MITKKFITGGFLLESNSATVKVTMRSFQNKKILTISVEDKKTGEVDFFKSVEDAIRVLKEGEKKTGGSDE